MKITRGCGGTVFYTGKDRFKRSLLTGKSPARKSREETDPRGKIKRRETDACSRFTYWNLPGRGRKLTKT